MNYEQTLQWMFAQLPMYQQKGKVAYTNKLDNIRVFAAYLHHPEQQFKSIHVAGTNGKGSCSHMLASILQEAGYTVGLYTSPHLQDFRERIKINGKVIAKDAVVDFIAKHQDFLEQHQLSFFEMTVAMAFSYFAEQQVDIAIIETGLGGRLDSTNIIIPEVCLITNIGLDHTHILGDTLAKIATEKAGIIKRNVPIVISEYKETTLSVFKKTAKENNAPLFLVDEFIIKDYNTDLLGNHQKKNIKGVVTIVKRLKGFEVEEHHIEKGLQNVVKNTGLQGRWQQLQKNPNVFCDIAHNKEALEIVIHQIKQESFDTLHIVLGFVRDKDLAEMLPLFPKDAIYYFCSPNVPRGLAAAVLQKKAVIFDLKGSIYKSVTEAYKTALENATTSDFIFIGGSTFVVSEIL